MVLVVPLEKPAVAPEISRLKAKDYLACQKADDIIAQARQVAQDLVAKANQDAKRETERGYNDGLRNGVEKSSQQIIDTVGKTVDYIASVEDKMVQVVIDALRKIIGDMDQRDVISRVIARALASIGSQLKITIRVHPSKADAVRQDINGILSKKGSACFIEVMADARLRESGCVLSSDMGTINADVEHQIGALKDALIKTFAQKR